MFVRPVLWYVIFYIIGILLAQFNNYTLILGCFITLIGFLTYIYGDYIIDKKIVFIGSIIFLIFGYFQTIFLFNFLNFSFNEYYEKEVSVIGYIISDPKIKTNIEYIVMVDTIENGRKIIKTNAKIILKTDDSKFNNLEHGTKIKFVGKLIKPSSAKNSGSFDYQRYLYSKNIFGTIFSKGFNIDLYRRDNKFQFMRFSKSIRNRILLIIEKKLPLQQANLLKAILLGYREGLSENMEEAFKAAGLTHIMAVSGSNVLFIILPILWILKRCRLNLRNASFVTIVIIWFFVFLTGFEVSVIRAVVMASIILLGNIIYRKSDISTSISIAGLLILSINPYTLFELSFQLSFVATISIVMIYPTLKEFFKKLKIQNSLNDIISGTLAAQIGVLPITLYNFNTLYPISIISNIIVVPITGIITVFGMITVIFGFFSDTLLELFSLIDNALLSFVLVVAKYSAQMKYSVITMITPSLIIIFLYYFCIFHLFFLKKFQSTKVLIKVSYLIIMTVLIINFFMNAFNKDLRVVFLDVGEGDCSLISTSSGKNILVDGGGYLYSKSERKDMGRLVVVPYLLDRGIKKLDVIISTHSDGDHIGGLFSIIDSIVVKKVFIPSKYHEEGYRNFIKCLDKKNIEMIKCNDQMKIILDSDTILDFLNPKAFQENLNTNENEDSIAFKLSYKNKHILFTADIEKETEARLVQEKENIQAEILKVSHHGSKSSSTNEFLKMVKPKISIISVGKNLYGHPKKEVLERLEQNNIKILRTDKEGAIELELSENKIIRR